MTVQIWSLSTHDDTKPPFCWSNHYSLKEALTCIAMSSILRRGRTWVEDYRAPAHREPWPRRDTTKGRRCVVRVFHWKAPLGNRFINKYDHEWRMYVNGRLEGTFRSSAEAKADAVRYAREYEVIYDDIVIEYEKLSGDLVVVPWRAAAPDPPR